MILNRLEKNYKKLSSWAKKYEIEAFRLYDRDIPEFPFIVDLYGQFVLIYDKSQKIDEDKNHLPLLLEAIKKLLNCSDDKIVLKKRIVQTQNQKYEKLDSKNEKIVVKENGVPLYVNLYDYLDTGLFLDHRPTRYHFLKNCKGHKFLNLFCYTASASVMAALAGATTYSVDMSHTYLEWAKENFKLNEIDLTRHFFKETDVLQFLQHAPDWPDFASSFDTIFLDPPTFSNSKSMKTDFDVERDQLFLISQAAKLLKPDGTLYFSNNKRDFKLSKEVLDAFNVKITRKQSIPQDFHDQKIHNSYEIRLKKN